MKRYRTIKDALDPARPLKGPTTFEGGQTCGRNLDLIAKVQANLPLTAVDRDIVLRALRKFCLTSREWKAYMRHQELVQYETAKKAAQLATEQKWWRALAIRKREQWLEALYGKTRTTLSQYMWRKRPKRRR